MLDRLIKYNNKNEHYFAKRCAVKWSIRTFFGGIADDNGIGVDSGDVVDADTVTEWRWEDPVTRKDYVGHRKVLVGEKLQEEKCSFITHL